MSIAANKFKGIRAAVCWNKSSTRQGKKHLDANIICLGTNAVAPKLAKEMLAVWLKTPFSDQIRHCRRLAKIKNLA